MTVDSEERDLNVHELRGFETDGYERLNTDC